MAKLSNIPTQEELNKLAQEAVQELKDNLKTVFSEANSFQGGYDIQSRLSQVRDLVEKHIDKIAELKFKKYADQLLVGAHVSEIIRLVKK